MDSLHSFFRCSVHSTYFDLSIHPSIHTSIYPSIHLSIHPSIHPSILRSVKCTCICFTVCSIYFYLSHYLCPKVAPYISYLMYLPLHVFKSWSWLPSPWLPKQASLALVYWVENPSSTQAPEETAHCKFIMPWSSWRYRPYGCFLK